MLSQDDNHWDFIEANNRFNVIAEDKDDIDEEVAEDEQKPKLQSTAQRRKQARLAKSSSKTL